MKTKTFMAWAVKCGSGFGKNLRGNPNLYSTRRQAGLWGHTAKSLVRVFVTIREVDK
jgi:hypothetical protein